MKKYLLTLIVAAAATFAAGAVSPTVYASYGGYTQMDATNCHDGWSGVNNAWGALNVGVDFNLTRNLSVGPSYTFSSTTTEGKHHSNIAYHAIMLNAKYNYYSNSIVTLYGHLGLGGIVSHMQPRGGDAYNKGYFGYQISPVGAKVGIGKGFDMFGELGFGSLGLVQVGFRYNL